MMLSFACVSVESVGLPSVVMWGDCGEVQCCGLSKVWNGGEGCDLHGLWLVLLESGMGQFLGVDPQDNMCRHVSDERLVLDLLRGSGRSIGEDLDVGEEAPNRRS
jgi:hypothetical protein